MKKLLLMSFMLCLSMQPLIAMENDQEEKLQEKACDFHVNMTLAFATATVLNAKLLHDEYKEHGWSSKSIKLTSSLTFMTFMTGINAYLTSNTCNR